MNMNRIITVFILLFISSVSVAQVISPVQWTFTSIKVTENDYEVRLTANVQSGWHIYSQNQPTDAINIPTEILFNKNPLIVLDGKAKETGIGFAEGDATLKGNVLHIDLAFPLKQFPGISRTQFVVQTLQSF